MSTHEAMLGISRRDLLFPFAKKGSRNKQLPQSRQTGPNHSPTQPKRPEKDGHKITRRQFIPLAGIGTAAGIGILSRILEPWNWFTPQPEPSRPETLESLVNQAKKMEDEYKFPDLSNKPIREKYAGIIAGIFAFHYPEYFPRQQLIETVTWTDTLDQFVRNRMASAGKTGTPTVTQLENERIVTASTDNRKRQVTVNTAADGFQQRLLTAEDLPRGWNPLKMLRISLLHEFNHLVTESTDDIIFSIIDPGNKFKDKRIEGFRFVSVDEMGRFAVSFTDLHEAVIELLAKDISLSIFGSHPSDMPSETPGVDMAVIINNLEQVLRAVGINHQELAKLHKSSNLREFLVILADKAGAGINTHLEDKLRFGSRIGRVIQENNQPLLQAYLNQVRSTNPTSSQK